MSPRKKTGLNKEPGNGATLFIRDMPSDLMRELRKQCAIQEVTIHDYVIRVLRNVLKKK
jgi:hypothetical protein